MVITFLIVAHLPPLHRRQHALWRDRRGVRPGERHRCLQRVQRDPRVAASDVDQRFQRLVG
jgi:hypothetical protein